MKVPATVRGSAAPRKTLVKRVEPLAAFFQRLGRLMYASDWRNPPVVGTSGNEAQIGTPEEMAEIVRGQIVGGIRSGKVKLIQSCNVNILQPKAVSNSGDIVTVSRRRAPAEDDDEPQWQASRTYWGGDPIFDWEESTISIDCSNVVDPQSKINLLGRFEDPKRPVTIYLLVDQPDIALRDLIEYSELPDEDWFNKYNRYVSIEARECAAAAWRAAAIVPLKNEHGVQERLVSEMSTYAAFRGFTISADALRNIARKIVEQWNSGDRQARIFVNSSRK